jgi:hypothetical protein
MCSVIEGFMHRREWADISFEWAFKLSEMYDLYFREPVYMVGREIMDLGRGAHEGQFGRRQ